MQVVYSYPLEAHSEFDLADKPPEKYPHLVHGSCLKILLSRINYYQTTIAPAPFNLTRNQSRYASALIEYIAHSSSF